MSRFGKLRKPERWGSPFRPGMRERTATISRASSGLAGSASEARSPGCAVPVVSMKPRILCRASPSGARSKSSAARPSAGGPSSPKKPSRDSQSRFFFRSRSDLTASTVCGLTVRLRKASRRAAFSGTPCQVAAELVDLLDDDHGDLEIAVLEAVEVILQEGVEAGPAGGRLLLEVDDLDHQVDVLLLRGDGPVGADHRFERLEVVLRQGRVHGRRRAPRAGLVRDGRVGLRGRFGPHSAVPIFLGLRLGVPVGGLADLFPILPVELDPAFGELRSVDTHLDRLAGQAVGQVGVGGPGVLSLGHDAVLQELVRGVVLDVREVALPERGDDVAVLGRLLGFRFDQLEQIEDLGPVQALVEKEAVQAVLEEEERQALDGHFVGVRGFPFVGEGEFLDADLELAVDGQEIRELRGQLIDEMRDRRMLAREDLHRRDRVGQGVQEVFDLLGPGGVGRRRGPGGFTRTRVLGAVHAVRSPV